MPHGVEGRGEIDAQRGVPIARFEVLDRLEVPHHGIVDDNVHGSETISGRPYHLADLRLAAEVGGIEQRLDAIGRLEAPGGLQSLLGRAQAVQDHVCPGARERLGEGNPEPAANRPRDQGASVLQHLNRLA